MGKGFSTVIVSLTVLGLITFAGCGSYPAASGNAIEEAGELKGFQTIWTTLRQPTFMITLTLTRAFTTLCLEIAVIRAVVVE